MSDSRILSIRKSDNIDEANIMLPLVFIGEKYGYSFQSILRQIHGSPEYHIGEYPHIFPHNISEYFWISRGEPGEKLWIALGQLNCGLYFLYTAFMNTPSNTFINNGHMDLWISARYSDIVNFAMDTGFYKDYISNTTSR
jgi:hypothetical protein